MDIVGLDDWALSLPAEEVSYIQLHRLWDTTTELIGRWDAPDDAEADPRQILEEADAWIRDAAADEAAGAFASFRVRAWALKGSRTVSSRRFRVPADPTTAAALVRATGIEGGREEAESAVALLLLRELAAHQMVVMEMYQAMHEERTKLHRESMNEALAMSREFRARLAESDKTLRSLHTTVFRMREQQAQTRLAAVLDRANQLEALTQRSAEDDDSEDSLLAEGIHTVGDWIKMFAAGQLNLPPEALDVLRKMDPAVLERLNDPRVHKHLSNPATVEQLLAMLDHLPD